MLDQTHDPIPAVADPLTEALQFLRMAGVFYCRSELTSPWSLGLPPMPDCVWFHVITAGSCVLVDDEGTEHHARRGDLVVFPHGAGHRATDDPSLDPALVMELPHEYLSPHYAVLRHGGDGERTDLVCGAVRLAHPAARDLLAVLPPAIRVDPSTDRRALEWLPGILGMIAAETAEPRPGGEAVVTRLCDILVISAIRSWIDTDPAARTGWLGALHDPQIGRAVALVHRHPERDWTVAELASTVAMSRSAFAARFKELVGDGPMRYVTRWRMNVATDLLREEGLTVAQAGARLGYASEAAFSRAYRRTTGTAPGAVRRSGPLDLGRAQLG
ncbi:MAG: AraC family transcriptional regulator [Ilumatobacter sp.]|nr:AraC family transcriptional regulator [Ilumatobacter sp.]